MIVDSRFSRMEGDAYQPPDCDNAASRVEITASSGGNAAVNTK
jgi:hypothetical protein